MERSPLRLLAEAIVGGCAGAIVLRVLSPSGVGLAYAVSLGAFVAPVALLLTPRTGPVAVRALRYGAAVSIVATLIVSFTFGPGGVSGAGLLGVAVLAFGIGTVGHALMAATVG